MSTELTESTPQEGLEGPSDDLEAFMGIPHPRTLDGALYEAYRAGWYDAGNTSGLNWHQRAYLMREAFKSWRRRFVTLPEVDDD